ncbi:MAG: hypothetical protein LUD17_00405 [Bacteroidales bacterium]|nr:hypothetical protein [Bacteroidales bacterium]
MWRLLRKNISGWQMAGYAIASIVGLAIVIIAYQFYRDARGLLGESETVTSEYAVLSRPVSMLSTFGIGAKASEGIDQEDIDALAQQPWAKRVGEFTAANFSVTGSVEFGGKSMWSHLFLEAVPDEFLDIAPRGWGFNPADGAQAEIPIIISKDYLALYNFGYASSRGLPQINEGMISKIPFYLYLSGNGHSNRYRARIVGFSTRLNTIAAPLDFIQWANERYAPGQEAQPSRLIVEVDDPGNPEIERFLSRAGLEVAGAGLDKSRAATVLKLVSSAIGAVGIAICALALFILSLSVTLLLQKNRQKNSNLLFLGYSPRRVAGCYLQLVGWINLGVTAAAIGALLIASYLWRGPLVQMGAQPSSPWAGILLGAIVMVIITAIAYLSIWRSLSHLK